MSDVEKARQLFQSAGLGFPELPGELAAQLKQRGEWLFSTRENPRWPYEFDQHVHEAVASPVENYAVLSHSGRNGNSYAIHYYVVYDAVRMFLQLSWGGVFMNPEVHATRVRECFSLADEILATVPQHSLLQAGDRLTIVGSNFGGSYWLAPGKSLPEDCGFFTRPAEVLTEVRDWLKVAPGRYAADTWQLQSI